MMASAGQDASVERAMEVEARELSPPILEAMM